MPRGRWMGVKESIKLRPLFARVFLLFTPMSTAPPTPIPPANEIDANGNIVYRFPPFPQPPPGVTIIPFKDFKPAGIQVPALGFPDGIERDGLGIPTCALKVRVDDNEHVSGNPKKKKKKGRRKYTGSVAGGVQADRRRLPWWEEWAIDEDKRGVREFDLSVLIFCCLIFDLIFAANFLHAIVTYRLVMTSLLVER